MAGNVLQLLPKLKRGQMPNLVVSAIRTYVPIGVGFAVAFLSSRLHFVIDAKSEAGLVLLFGSVASSLYWTLVRLIERRCPRAGVLLGVPAKPTYSRPVPLKRAA